MSRYQLAYDADAMTAKIQAYGDATISGHETLDDFYHGGGGTDELDANSSNHTLYHHVQEILYHEGVLDMQSVEITCKRLTGISSSPATVTKAATQTQQITNTFTPTDAANRNVTYVSSDPTKATVNASGLITAVATGSATITVNTEDGGWTDTVVVTVS